MTNLYQTNKKTSSQAWVVCMVAALFFFYEFAQLNMFNAIDHGVMRDFSLNAEGLGRLSSLYFYSNLLFLFPAGILLDRYSPRRLILISMAVCVAGTFLFASADSFWLAASARFLTGIGSAFCFLGPIRLATRWISSRHLALASGLIVTMAMAGGMAAQTPLTLLVELLGWRHALYVDGTIGIVFLVLIFFVVQDFPKEMSALKKIEKTISAGFMRGLRQSYLNKQNWFCGIYTSLMNLPIFIIGAIWGQPYLTQARGLTTTQASLVTTMVFVGTVVGSPVMGWFSDYIGKRRSPMIYGALLSFILILFVMFLPDLDTLALALIFLVIGFVTSTQVLSYPAVAESNPRELSATAISVISFSAIGGGALFQPLFGRILDTSGVSIIKNGVHIYPASSYLSAMAILPAAFVLSFFVALFIRETLGRHN